MLKGLRPFMIAACVVAAMANALVVAQPQDATQIKKPAQSKKAAESKKVTQSKKVAFKHLSVNDGLSHNNVIDIVQDRFGYLWFGTESGLNMYDGYSVTVFKNEIGNEKSLSNNWIYSVFEDSNGDIWAATEDGLNRFDRSTKTFDRFLTSASRPDGKKVHVWAINEDTQGRLLLGTYRGLLQYDVARDSLQQFRHESERPASISADTVNAIFADKEGRIWVGTRRGLNLFDEGSGSFLRFNISEHGTRYFSENSIQTIAQDSEGSLWVGTMRGLNVFNVENRTFKKYTAQPGVPGQLQGDVIWETYEDSKGHLWITTRRSGLYRYERETDTFTHIKADPGDPTTLASNRLQSIIEDHSGVLWIASPGNGLNYVDQESGSFELIKHNAASVSSLSINEVLGITEDWTNPDILWIGTGSGGLNRFDRSTREFTVYRHDPDDSQSLSNDVVEAILVDSKGEVWVGTWAGLDRLDRATGTFTRYFTDELFQYRKWKRIIYEPPSEPGILWIASGAGGLIRYDVEAGTHVRYENDPDDELSLSGNWVSALFEDREGRLWVGTERGGLNRFDRDLQIFRRYMYDIDVPHSLRSRFVYAINQTPDGMLWLGSDNGLVKFDADSTHFAHFTIQNSDLPNNTIYNIIQDDYGAFWLSTLGGLSRFNIEAESFVNYDLDRGLQARAFHPFAAAKGSTGELYFGGPGGLNAFYPDEIRDNARQPRIVFSDFKLFNQSVQPSEESPLKQPVESTPSIELAHNQNDVTFDYVGLHYSNPERITYAYKLEPYDDDWRDVGTLRRAIYTNLTPGQYTFFVRAISPDGISSDAAEMPVRISAPWWQRPWAYGLYALMLLVGVWGTFTIQKNRLIKKEQERARIREAELRAEAAELESQASESEARALRAENERKESELQQAKQLQKAYGELEASMNELQKTQQQLIQSEKMASLGKLTAGIAHELKNPLNFVTNFAVVVRESVEELADTISSWAKGNSEELDTEDLKDLVDMISVNTSRIEAHGTRADRIVNSMMDHVRISKSQFESVHLNELVDQFVNLAYTSFTTENETFEVALHRSYAPENPHIKAFPQELGKVFYNLLNNSFYAVQEQQKRGLDAYLPEVHVKTLKENGYILIRVSDNGIGISGTDQDKVFEPFYTTKPTGKGSIGLGLSLSYDIIVNGHGGDVTLDSEEGKGATFEVKLPVS